MSGNAETVRLRSASDGPEAKHAWFKLRRALPAVLREVPAAEIQIFVAIIILASIYSYAFPDSFATTGTLLNMARVAGIMLVVSIGQSFALIVGGFDISVGATMGLVSVICALLMKHGLGVNEAVALGVLAGATVGLINGIGISILGVTPFVMTLGMLTAARGLADQLANGRVITGFPPRLRVLWPSRMVGRAQRRLYSRRGARDRLVHPAAYPSRAVHFLNRRQPRNHAGGGCFRRTL